MTELEAVKIFAFIAATMTALAPNVVAVARRNERLRPASKVLFAEMILAAIISFAAEGIDQSNRARDAELNESWDTFSNSPMAGFGFGVVYSRTVAAGVAWFRVPVIIFETNMETPNAAATRGAVALFWMDDYDDRRPDDKRGLVRPGFAIAPLSSYQWDLVTHASLHYDRWTRGDAMGRDQEFFRKINADGLGSWLIAHGDEDAHLGVVALPGLSRYAVSILWQPALDDETVDGMFGRARWSALTLWPELATVSDIRDITGIRIVTTTDEDLVPLRAFLFSVILSDGTELVVQLPPMSFAENTDGFTEAKINGEAIYNSLQNRFRTTSRHERFNKLDLPARWRRLAW